MHLLHWLTVSATAVGALALVPRPVHACGGTFCDAGPTAMPVDQTGENVLFILDGPQVEAHIQIQYDPTTEADQFAWVIPVSAIPEFSVGSDPLFQALLAGSVPSYGLTQVSACQGPDPDANGDGGAPSGFITMSDGGGASFEPEVVLHEVVGALDVTVLSGGTAEELVQWLDTNGYQQDPAALPILTEYVQEGWMFAAIKLAHSAGVDQIHPLVMNYVGDEACVPLRLTRIAAAEDMGVRTFFLGDDRVAPTNYKHVLVNPLKLDWLNNADNYAEVITLAVDEAGGEGRAFVTEYAGDSSVVPSGFYDPSWDPTVFISMNPVNVMDTLQSWNLGVCGRNFGGCGFSHPLILPLLREFLPAPEGVDEVEFYLDLAQHFDQIDQDIWDGSAFALAFEERIVAPAFHASELLDRWPYLTRMYTTISPGEMTVDPIFHGHPGLPEVDNRTQIATEALHCDGSSAVTLPDGRVVFLPAGAPWPDFQTEMPWVEESADMPEMGGAPLPLFNNTAQIDELLTAYNQSHGWPPEPGAGGDDAADGTAGGATAGGDTDGMGTTGDGPGADGGPGGVASEGCGCTTSHERGAGWLWLLGAVGVGLRLRRRRD